MKRSRYEIADDLRSHLFHGGCANDSTTEDLFYEFYDWLTDRDAELEDIEDWCNDLVHHHAYSRRAAVA